MNKFGTPELTPLIAKLRKGASAVYLATPKPVADDIAEMMRDAADSLEAADGYFKIVEGALV